MKNSIAKRKNIAIGIISVAVMLILWELLSLLLGSKHILPGPWETLKAALGLFVEKDFLLVVGHTVLRGLIGFAIAVFFGIALGIVAGQNSGIDAFLRPWLVVMRSTPVVAFTLLALIWFKSNGVPVFIAILTMFPMICINIIDGMKSVDNRLIDMARFYKVGRGRIVKEVYVPAIAPFIVSGVSSAVGIGWRAIIVGEVLSQPEYGIGSRMQSAQSFLNVEALIAWTIVAVLLSFIFEKIIRGCERKFLKWL